MKITGYKLREAIRRWQLVRDTAAGQFKESLHRFAGETKEGPNEIAAKIATAEESIALLQAAQAVYNVRSRLDDGTLLAFAYKRMGGLERLERHWRGAAIEKKDKYHYVTKDPLVRKSDELVAERLATREQCAARAGKIARQIGDLREQLARANVVEVDITELDLSASLLE